MFKLSEIQRKAARGRGRGRDRERWRREGQNTRALTHHPTQDFNLFVTKLAKGQTINVALEAGRQAYLLCVEGSVAVSHNGDALESLVRCDPDTSDTLSRTCARTHITAMRERTHARTNNSRIRTLWDTGQVQHDAAEIVGPTEIQLAAQASGAHILYAEMKGQGEDSRFR